MKDKICTWQEDSDGYWKTGCNNYFVVTEGIPSENKMKYCCYCGGILNELRFSYKRKPKRS